jgi:hypothetical protein
LIAGRRHGGGTKLSHSDRIERIELDSTHVFAAVLLIILLTVVFNALVRAIERRTVVWQSAGRREAAAAPTVTRVLGNDDRQGGHPCRSTCCRPRWSAAIRNRTG